MTQDRAAPRNHPSRAIYEKAIHPQTAAESLPVSSMKVIIPLTKQIKAVDDDPEGVLVNSANYQRR